MLSAVIFDVDGTLADTERDGHRPAFNRAFAEHGLGYEWDVETYGRLLGVTGGQRRIAGYLTAQGHPDPAGVAPVLHRAKTGYFAEWVRSGAVHCRPGVDVLIADLRRHGVRCAVATTGTRAWVLPLLDQLVGLDAFDHIVTGDDVEHLKPAPDVYLQVLGALGVAPGSALAVEDSPPGLASARAAGLACLVVTNGYTRGSSLPGAVAVRDTFVGIDTRWCSDLLQPG